MPFETIKKIQAQRTRLGARSLGVSNARLPSGSRQRGAGPPNGYPHWDALDPTNVLAQAYELAEEELLGEEDFSDLVCGNATRSHGGIDRNFFKGTWVEHLVL